MENTFDEIDPIEIRVIINILKIQGFRKLKYKNFNEWNPEQRDD